MIILIASAASKICTRWNQVLREGFSVLEVRDLATLRRSLVEHKPAVLLLDLSLPKLGGVAGVSTVQHLSPSTKTIAFARNPDDKEAIRALGAGVKGYCKTDIDPFYLKRAVEVVQKGEIWISRRLVPILLGELTPITERREKGSSPQSQITHITAGDLTSRELQVARLIADGACNKEISARLGITERTVKAHLTSIFRKLKIPDRVRLALVVSKDNGTAGSRT